MAQAKRKPLRLRLTVEQLRAILPREGEAAVNLDLVISQNTDRLLGDLEKYRDALRAIIKRADRCACEYSPCVCSQALEELADNALCENPSEDGYSCSVCDECQTRGGSSP